MATNLVQQFRSSAKERTITGKMPSKGHVRIGRAYIINHEIPTISHDPIENILQSQQINILSKAVTALNEQIEQTESKLEEQPIEVVLELEGILGFLKTSVPSLYKKIKRKIEDNTVSAASATESVINEFIGQLKNKGEFGERLISDYKDLGDRLIRRIFDEEGKKVNHPNLGNAPEDCFVIADMLSPSDCIHLVARNIRGLIIQHGAATGHVAVIAKELGIPCIFTESDIPYELHDDMPVIIDGENGVAYLNPSDQTIESFEDDFKKEERKRELRQKFEGKKIKLLNGMDARVYANINFTSSAHRAKTNMSDGIGLYRTEWLFTSSKEEPSIETQRKAYNYVIKAVDGHATTFRLLDTEGDKNEDNWLQDADRWELMHNQVEAIMLAASDNNVPARILLPVVRDPSELDTIQNYIDKIKEKFTVERASVPETKLGMMIEIPQAAYSIKHYLKHADFFSFGSNDLIAWACGQIRGSEKHEKFEDPTNQMVLNMLENVISAAQEAGKPISLCGRIASNPKYAAMLLGLGLTHFSAGVENVLDMKEIIEKIDVNAAKEMVATIKAEPSREKREAILNEFNANIDHPAFKPAPAAQPAPSA